MPQKMIKRVMKNYKMPFVLLVLTSLLIILLLPNPNQWIVISRSFFYNVNWIYFLLGGIGGIVAIFSFFFPYFAISFSFRGRANSRKILKTLFKYVFYDCIGEDSQRYMLKKLGFKNFKFLKVLIKISEITAIFIISAVFLPFTDQSFKPFYACFLLAALVFGVIVLFYSMSTLRKFKFRALLTGIFFSIIRYTFEFPKVYFLLLAINLKFNLATGVLFMTTTSLLYFVRGFKSAAGLLCLYMVGLYTYLGYHPLYGVLATIIFRLNAILFYVIPYYMLHLISKKELKW